MRRVGNIYGMICDRENVARALSRAAAGVRKTPAILDRLDNFMDTVDAVRDLLVRKAYAPGPYREMVVTEPKRRVIHVLPFFPDRIVQHAVVDVVGPLVWEPRFIADSYACRAGKGTHRGIARAAGFVRRNAWDMRYDIRDFYHSIDHAVLRRLLARSLKDPDALDILYRIIGSFGWRDGRGCPIGNLTSQWFGNVYLNALDHFVKERLRVACYVRYCDDFHLFAGTKAELKACDAAIGPFVEDTLRMAFSKRNLQRTADGCDFLGARIFPRKILLRRSTARRIRRRMEGIRRVLDRGGLTGRRVQSMLGCVSSAMGSISHMQTRNFSRSIGLEGLRHDVRRAHQAFFGNGHTRHHGGPENPNRRDAQQGDRADAHGMEVVQTHQGGGREPRALRDGAVLLRGRSRQGDPRGVHRLAHDHGPALGQAHGVPVRGEGEGCGKLLLPDLREVCDE